MPLFGTKKKKKKKKTTPRPPMKKDIRGDTTGWVPHPSKEGWEINIMDMNERRIKKK